MGFKLRCMKSSIKKVILLSSIAGTAVYVIYAVYGLIVGAQISLSMEDLLYEFLSLLILLPLVVPGMLGLLKFSKSPHLWTKTVLVCYLLYAIAIMLTAAIFLLPSDDPLAVGIPLVVMIVPACLIITIVLVVQWLGNGRKD